MVKVTIYLPEKLKRQLKRVAVRTKRSQAEIIREAIEAALRRQIPPEPRIPLFAEGLGDATIAERVDELLWNDRKR
jgi:predicted transcriptional regulator